MSTVNPGMRLMRRLALCAAALVALPAHAVVVSYVAAPSYSQTAYIVQPAIFDSATGDPPADVSANYPPRVRGGAVG